MDWDDITIAMVGYSLYVLALLLKSTSIRHLRFSRFIDLAKIKDVPGPYRKWTHAVLLSASIVLMATVIWNTVNLHHKIFVLLAGLGALLVIVRVASFFFNHITFLGLEIETVRSSKLNIPHLLHSPFVVGGTALLLIGGLTPLVTDTAFHYYFNERLQADTKKVEESARRQDFDKKYVIRVLDVQATHSRESNFVAQNETEFFDRLDGKCRFLIVGRAGIGKSWFLMSLRFHFQKHHPNRHVIYVKASELTGKESVLGLINERTFGKLGRVSLPVTRKIVNQAVVLIDGLDEVVSLSRESVVEAIETFAKSHPDNTVIVTTRPVGLNLSPAFLIAKICPLSPARSKEIIEMGNAALSEKIRSCARKSHVESGNCRFFFKDKLPSWNLITAQETGRIYNAFLKTFAFEEDGFKDRLPFLSTYLDMEIMEELFMKTLDGSLRFDGKTRESMRMALVEQFLLRRIEYNYKRPGTNRKTAEEGLHQLIAFCRCNSRERPIRFERQSLKVVFQDTTFDKFALESELLVEANDVLKFESQPLEEYCVARSKQPDFTM